MPSLYNITLNSKMLSQLKLDVNGSFVAETTEKGYFYEYSKKKHDGNDIIEVQLVKRIDEKDSIIINSAIYEKVNSSQFKLIQINIFEYLDNNSYIESIQYYSNNTKRNEFLGTTYTFRTNPLSAQYFEIKSDGIISLDNLNINQDHINTLINQMNPQAGLKQPLIFASIISQLSENNLQFIRFIDWESVYFTRNNYFSSGNCNISKDFSITFPNENKNKEFVIIPFAAMGHNTILFVGTRENIDNSKKLFIFDSSNFHTDQIDLLFGKFVYESTNKITSLNIYNLQGKNGVCAYFSICTVVEASNNYETLDQIQQDCTSGLFQLKVASRVSEMVDVQMQNGINAILFNKPNDAATRDLYQKYQNNNGQIVYVLKNNDRSHCIDLEEIKKMISEKCYQAKPLDPIEPTLSQEHSVGISEQVRAQTVSLKRDQQQVQRFNLSSK